MLQSMPVDRSMQNASSNTVNVRGQNDGSSNHMARPGYVCGDLGESSAAQQLNSTLAQARFGPIISLQQRNPGEIDNRS